MGIYYDGTKLLSLPDINGNKPEIVVCVSNRSAGKTTFFNRYLVKRFLKNGEKFGILFRYKNELADCANKFFNEIGGLFFTGYTMTSKPIAGGYIAELFIHCPDNRTPIPCGYAFALNSADKLKKFSHLLSDVNQYIFDEFQTENNLYLPDEIKKFISVHTSIARGGGSQSRFARVIMLSNTVTLLNPYFVAWGISSKMTNQNFTRGNGWVLEHNFNESAATAQQNSIFNSAFQNEKYVEYSKENVYLNDSESLIERPSGNSKYIATFIIKNEKIGVFEYADAGIIYASRNIVQSCPRVLMISNNDIDKNYLILRENKILIDLLRFYFSRGCFRFSDVQIKQHIINTLSY